MTCVLSMTAVYNHPCNGFNNKSDEGGGRLDFGWISPPPSSLLQEGAGFTCRRESQSVVFPTEKSGSIVPQKAAENDKSHRDRDGDIKMREDTHEKMCHGLKRKLETNSENSFSSPPPPKRISPFLNTPKERKEERRKVLKISIQKLKQVEDPEHFLRRSVLINNTLKKVQKEMREEKKRHRYSRGFSKGYNIYRLRPSYDYDILNNSYLSSNAYFDMFDDPFSTGENEKITDDMTDLLENSLEAQCYNSPASNCNSSTSTEAPATQSSPTSLSSTLSSSQLPSSESVVDESDNLTQRERQICADMDVVFNNLIRTLGET